MATKMKPAEDIPNYVAPEPGYHSVDRRGVWFLSRASFVIEDPTNAGKGPLTRFEPKSYTQATPTNFVLGQWAARVLVRYDGDPRDEGTKEVPFEAEPAPAPKAAVPAPTAAPTPAPTAAPTPAPTAAPLQNQGKKWR